MSSNAVSVLADQDGDREDWMFRTMKQYNAQSGGALTFDFEVDLKSRRILRNEDLEVHFIIQNLVAGTTLSIGGMIRQLFLKP